MIKQIFSKLHKSQLLNFNEFQREKWVKAQASQIPDGSRVLDLGAGSCPYRMYFGHCLYHTQDFSELSEDQIRFREGYGEIDYVSDVTEIPVEDDYFDVVINTEVLEHVPNPVAVLNEIFRVLVPGGLLLLTAPLGSGIHQEPYHFYGGYTPWFYEKYLAETGFDEILVLANGGFYKHYSQETLRFIKSTQPWRTEVGFVFKVVWFPFWLLLLPVMLLVAVVSFFLDPIDQEKRFTVGYFVRAEKKQTGTLRE